MTVIQTFVRVYGPFAGAVPSQTSIFNAYRRPSAFLAMGFLARQDENRNGTQPQFDRPQTITDITLDLSSARHSCALNAEQLVQRHLYSWPTHSRWAVLSRPWKSSPRVNPVFSYSPSFLQPLPLPPRIILITFDPKRSRIYTLAWSPNQRHQQHSTPGSQFNSVRRTSRTQND